jgi:uncharacterized protein YoxC
MNAVLITFLTLTGIVAVCVLVAVLLELRNTIKSLNVLLTTTESQLKPTLEEVQQSLKSIRGITDNVNAVTEDVRVLSTSVREVGENVQRITELVDDAAASASIRVSGVKAGVRAAAEVLARNFVTGRRR